MNRADTEEQRSVAASASAHGEARMQAINRQFYEPLWNDARLVMPDRFNTWPLVSSLVGGAQARLEIAPGLRPRLPLAGTQFIDFSAAAVRKLQSHGAQASVGRITALPFSSGCFGLVCAFDIVEHVDDDDLALAEIARVCAPGATLLLSAPLHSSQWTAFDDFVGHRRRYEPEALLGKLASHGFHLERSAIFGMQPRSSWLLDLGLWFLTHRRRRAMWVYNHLLMPLGLRFQKPLELVAGLPDTAGVDEVLMVCRKY